MAKFISGTDASDSSVTHTINQISVIKVVANSSDQAVIEFNNGGFTRKVVTIDNTLTEVLAMTDVLVALEVFTDNEKTSTVSVLINSEAPLTLAADGTDSVVRYVPFKSTPEIYKVDLTLAQLEALLETSGLQSVTTSAASSITTTAATLNGVVLGYVLSEIDAMGFAWGTSNADDTRPNINDDNDAALATNVIGAISKGLTGLTTGTTYYVRAYVIADGGSPVYGSRVSFTTL